MVYVVGHRGAAGLVPENTLKGFRYAIELGVDYVECDVHLTRDGHLIVMHDERVDRTTNGTGLIRELDFATIRSLDAGEGEVVPTLDEVLETIKGHVQLLCELKGRGVAAAAVEAVLNHGMAKDVVFTSFRQQELLRVKEIDPHLRVGQIFVNPTEEDIVRAAEMGASGIGVQYKNVCLRIIEQARAHNLEIRAWNPDTLPEQQAMLALGVDGISTNRPDILIDYLRKVG